MTMTMSHNYNKLLFQVGCLYLYFVRLVLVLVLDSWKLRFMHIDIHYYNRCYSTFLPSVYDYENLYSSFKLI